MSTVLLTQDIWPELTRAVRGARQRCAVAVAYFGAGAKIENRGSRGHPAWHTVEGPGV